MSFLDSVQLPGDKEPAKKRGGFLDSVTLPDNPMKAAYNSELQREAISLKRTSDEANSFTGIAKQTLKNPFVWAKDLGVNMVKGIYEQYKNPTPLTRSMEESLPKAAKPVAAPFLRTFMPGVEPLVTDAASAIIFNSKGLTQRFEDEIANGNIMPGKQTAQSYIGTSAMDATRKSGLQVVGDTAQAVLSAYSPTLFGKSLDNFASKGIKQAVTVNAINGAEAGFAFGMAQAASSGSKDPKEISNIILSNTVMGAVLNVGTSAVVHGFAKSLTEAVAKVREMRLDAPGEIQRSGMGPEASSPVAAEVPRVEGGFLDTARLPEGSEIGPKPNKSPFVNGQIRDLTPDEAPRVGEVLDVVQGKSPKAVLSEVPGFASADGKQRALVFSKEISSKVISDHGAFSVENLIINANDWDYVIRNVAGNPDKINLIKEIPGSDSYLTIGANRDNGYFVVTHYEINPKKGTKLKNLLRNKGDALDRSGRAAVPSFATSPEGAASQLDLSGVRTDDAMIADNAGKVKQSIEAADPLVEEARKGEYVTLKRGDSQEIKNFSLGKTDPNALFGQGIYLTDSSRVAADYTAKGGNTLFRYGGNTKEQAVEAYIRRRASYLDKNLKEQFTQSGYEGSPMWKERYAHAKAQFENELPNLDIRKLGDGDIVIREKSNAGKITEMNVPKEWFSKLINAEKRVTPEVGNAFVRTFERLGERGSINDLKAILRPDEDGFMPTFREVYKEIPGDLISDFRTADGQKIFRDELGKLGYKGIEYQGGISIGGAGKHKAYVFFDEQGLAKANKSTSLYNKAKGEALGVDVKAKKAQKTALEQKLRDTYSKRGEAAEEALSNLMVEMELAEPGKRIIKGYGADVEVTGKSSTFPKWVPDELRKKDLFNKLLERFESIGTLSYPQYPRQQRLFYAILQELDARLGIDTSDIRAKLADNANTNNRGASEAGNRSSTGNQRGGDISADDILDKWNTNEPQRGAVAAPVEGKATSKVAKSVNAKSIERGLTEGFSDLAGYDPITIRDQAERAAKLMQKDIELAKRMVKGETAMEPGLRPETLIKAMEDHAVMTGDVDLMRDIASSPLVSDTSAHAQALRLLAERNPDSPVKIMQDVRKAREANADKKTGGKTKEAKQKVISDMKKEIKKNASKRPSWEEFINEITCNY